MYLHEINPIDNDWGEMDLAGFIELMELEGIVDVDPRVIQKETDHRRFKISNIRHHHKRNKTYVDIDRYYTDEWYAELDDNGWLEDSAYLRVYDPAREIVPSFNSKTYNYHGLKNERAPRDTVKGFVDESATVIEDYAFADCEDMEVCEMHDNIEEIGMEAFSRCRSLKRIKLSRNLKRIGENAFLKCESLQAVFVPPSVEEIEFCAFAECGNMRVLSLPPNMTTEQIRYWAFIKCDPIEMHDNIIYSLIRNHPPLHRTCLNTNVTAQAINECIEVHGTDIAHIRDRNGMKPLHILAMNPHADSSTLFACFKVNMNAVFENDNDDRKKSTPLDYLLDYNVDGHLYLIRELCLHREAHMKGHVHVDEAAAATGADNSVSTRTKKRKI